jgi:DNA-directed RNA polymerase subunit RPC12/RpoP
MNGYEILCMICGVRAMIFIRPTEWKYKEVKDV